MICPYQILYYKNEIIAIVNKLLLAGNKCMAEMHLRQPGFDHSPCGKNAKNKKKKKKKLKKLEIQDIFIKTN